MSQLVLAMRAPASFASKLLNPIYLALQPRHRGTKVSTPTTRVVLGALYVGFMVIRLASIVASMSMQGLCKVRGLPAMVSIVLLKALCVGV